MHRSTPTPVILEFISGQKNPEAHENVYRQQRRRQAHLDQRPQVYFHHDELLRCLDYFLYRKTNQRSISSPPQSSG